MYHTTRTGLRSLSSPPLVRAGSDAAATPHWPAEPDPSLFFSLLTWGVSGLLNLALTPDCLIPLNSLPSVKPERL